jgi:hypothetical protein
MTLAPRNFHFRSILISQSPCPHCGCWTGGNVRDAELDMCSAKCQRQRRHGRSIVRLTLGEPRSSPLGTCPRACCLWCRVQSPERRGRRVFDIMTLPRLKRMACQHAPWDWDRRQGEEINQTISLSGFLLPSTGWVVSGVFVSSYTDCKWQHCLRVSKGGARRAIAHPCPGRAPSEFVGFSTTYANCESC